MTGSGTGLYLFWVSQQVLRGLTHLGKGEKLRAAWSCRERLQCTLPVMLQSPAPHPHRAYQGNQVHRPVSLTSTQLLFIILTEVYLPDVLK